MRDKRARGVLGVVAAALGLAGLLGGCVTPPAHPPVSTVDWKNRAYTVSSQSCLTNGTVTVKNGTGVIHGVRVDVYNTIFGDWDRDFVQDVAIVLLCRTINKSGSEVQIFTSAFHNWHQFVGPGQPVQRLVPPAIDTAGNPLHPKFDLNFVTNSNAYLDTAVVVWKGNDDPCCPSFLNTYRWTTNGSRLFAVSVNPAVTVPLSTPAMRPPSHLPI